MGINGVGGVNGITGVYGKKGNLKIDRPKEVQVSKDVASISKSGQDFATVMKALREVPDVRNEKVQELGTKIENGEYKVSEKDIAEKLASNMLSKKV